MVSEVETWSAEQKEFLQEFALALWDWGYVEDCLVFVLTALVQARPSGVVSAMYHAVSGFTVRLGMIDAAAEIALEERAELLKEWRALSKKTRSQAKNRNPLAHLQRKSDGKRGWVLRHAGFDTRRRVHRSELRLTDLKRIREEFGALSEGLFLFSERAE